MKLKNLSADRFTELLNTKSEEILKAFETDKPGHSLAAWFLGPKAENKDLLKRLIVNALDQHCQDRIDTYPNDPVYVTPEIKESQEYKDTVKVLETKTNALINTLKGSVPFWSYRWQSHMNWDTTLPGMIGYFSAMLYNPNNVAAEASPITTILEMKVGDEISEMLGYNIDSDKDQPRSWGHITCDGSIANNEAMWAARNLKFYPVSLVQALKNEESLAFTKEMLITLPTGQQKKLIELTSWEQLNLQVDEILDIPNRILADKSQITEDQFTEIMDKYSIQNLGFDQIKGFMDSEIQQPIVAAPSDMHYSWPKSAAVLGIGANNVIKVHVDLDARMRIDKLEQEIDKAIAEKRPIIMVVAVIGSTEESAVDPLKKILELRKEYNKKGIDFVVHSDAAWGGYFASILREPKEKSRLDKVLYTPALVMNKYVTEQYENLQYSDSITIDPHKAGYVQYPAGGLCYRNGAMRNMVAFAAPVVYHGGVDPTVGIYGLEGSKPGAAPTGVYLSHQVIPPDQTGYGKILGKCLFNSKRLYSAFVTLAEPEDPFIIEAFQRLPAVKNNESPEKVKEQYDFIKNEIVPKTNEEIMANKEAMRLFPELGSDQVIITYAFNFKVDGVLNTDTEKMNTLNFNLFKRLSLAPGHDDVNNTPLLVTQSQFAVDSYGKELVDNFKGRLGVSDSNDTPVTFLITTTMNPWLTNTSEGNFIPKITEILKKTVNEEILKIQKEVLVTESL